MHTSYIGIQGRACGPIQLGINGVWASTTTNASGQNGGTISFTNKVFTNDNAPEFSLVRGGTPNGSTVDPHILVSYELMQRYCRDIINNGTVPPIDTGIFVEKTRFNELYNVVLGEEYNYHNANSIALRVDQLELTSNNSATAITDLQSNVRGLQTATAKNTANITELNYKIENLEIPIFKEPTMLIAGGAADV